MARYSRQHVDKEEWKTIRPKLNSLDWVVLRKCEGRGSDVVTLLNASKPFKNKVGRKVFATTDQVLGTIKKLRNMGLLLSDD